MKNLKTDKDRIQLALDFANLNIDSQRTGDLMNLKDDLGEFIPVADGSEGSIPTNTVLFDVHDEANIKRLKERLKQIQEKLRGYLDSLYGQNFLETLSPKLWKPYSDVFLRTGVIYDESVLAQLRKTAPLDAITVDKAITDNTRETRLELRVRGTGAGGSSEDMFIFRLMMLLAKLARKIFKCPLCARYFLKRGIKRFCSPRCQVNWANRKYYKNQQARKLALELHKRKGLSASAILKRLQDRYNLNKTEILSWIKESQKPASVRQSKAKRRK